MDGAYLRTFSAEWFSALLREAGFSGVDPLGRGVANDTNYRHNLFAVVVDRMGDGDLRFLLTKTGDASEPAMRLPIDPQRAGKAFHLGIVRRFVELFNEYE